MGASMKGGGTQGDHQNKRKYADAALDAAASFVETLQAVIKSGKMAYRMPLIVSVDPGHPVVIKKLTIFQLLAFYSFTRTGSQCSRSIGYNV